MNRTLKKLNEYKWYHQLTLAKYFNNAIWTSKLQSLGGDRFIVYYCNNYEFLKHPKTKRLRLLTYRTLSEVRKALNT